MKPKRTHNHKNSNSKFIHIFEPTHKKAQTANICCALNDEKSFSVSHILQNIDQCDKNFSRVLLFVYMYVYVDDAITLKVNNRFDRGFSLNVIFNS